jgi:hypothetical protein
MENQETSQETVVAAPVDAVQTQDTSATSISSEQQTGVNAEVAAQVTDEKDFGPALKAELARREAQIEKKYADQVKQGESHQQNLERIAKHYGFETHSDYMTALDKFEQEKQIADEAAKLGVDESIIRDHLEPMKKQIAQFEQEKEALKQERLQVQINADIADLKTRYPDFEKHQDKVFELAIEKGYKLEDAYKLATYEDKISSIAQQTEAETLRKIQQNRETATGSLGAGGVEHKTGFAAMSKDDQRRMIEEVKQGKRTSFD